MSPNISFDYYYFYRNRSERMTNSFEVHGTIKGMKASHKHKQHSLTKYINTNQTAITMAKNKPKHQSDWPIRAQEFWWNQIHWCHLHGFNTVFNMHKHMLKSETLKEESELNVVFSHWRRAFVSDFVINFANSNFVWNWYLWKMAVD